jgi:hypothetical protein
VISRANRITNRLASVAETVTCQRETPKRRLSSSPTATESPLGSIVVMPFRRRSSTASAVTGGECPVIAPVSPRQRSA